MLVEIKARKAHHITVIGKCYTLSSPKLGCIIYYINVKDVISFRKATVIHYHIFIFIIIFCHYYIRYVLNSKAHQT